MCVYVVYILPLILHFISRHYLSFNIYGNAWAFKTHSHISENSYHSIKLTLLYVYVNGQWNTLHVCASCPFSEYDRKNGMVDCFKTCIYNCVNKETFKCYK